MKIYWPLAVILLILAAVLGMSRYADSLKRHYEETHAHVRTTSVADDRRSKPNDQPEEAYKPPAWGKYVTFPEGLGAWAVVFTLLAIVWQSIETRKSAQAAAESVNAAYGSLTFAGAQWELMREKERARLDISVQRASLEVEVAEEHLVHVIATVSVRNIGASRAFVRRTSGNLITRVGEESPDVDYSPLDLPEQFIEPDNPPVQVKVYCFPTVTAQTFAECLEQGTFSLHLFGFIEYESPGGRWRKEFGYDWQVLERGMGALYGLTDLYPNSPRPARDRITYGYWSANEEKDKPEYATTDEADQPTEDKTN